MDSRISAASATMVAIPSVPRPTATSSASRFGELLARDLVRGAQGIARSFPGAPLLALATRGPSINPNPFGASVGGAPLTPFQSAGSSRTLAGPTASPVPTSQPEGPGVSQGEGVEGSLSQGQELNFYFLQLQEQVNAQNRQFTAISNVLKAQHETVKTAIGNIR